MDTPSHLFVHTVNLYRAIESKDSDGSPIKTWVPVLTSLPCRIQTIRGDELFIAGGDRNVYDAKIYCAIVDILETDRVYLGTTVYEVIAVRNIDHIDTFLTVDLRELK